MDNYIKIRFKLEGKAGETAWAIVDDKNTIVNSVNKAFDVQLDNDLSEYPFESGDKIAIRTVKDDLPLVDIEKSLQYKFKF